MAISMARAEDRGADLPGAERARAGAGGVPRPAVPVLNQARG